jgi:hypothetical protein
MQTACGGTVTLVWRNDAYLQYLEESIQEDFPHVIVLNRGAHYVDDDVLLHNVTQNLHQLEQWQMNCRARGHRSCLALWRTTVPGTPGCNTTDGDNRYTTPNNDRSVMEDLVNDPRHYTNHTLHYRWPDFARQNDRVVDLWQHSRVEHAILDAYDLNILRPDLHRAHQGDCLHNCYPGKMDVYNQLLLHAVVRHLHQEKAIE